MLLSLKKAFVLVLMALALLAGLFGWSIRMSTMPATPHHSGVHSTHMLAWYCLPPPRNC